MQPPLCILFLIINFSLCRSSLVFCDPNKENIMCGRETEPVNQKASMDEIIEHVALLSVREEEDPSLVVSSLSSLNSWDDLIYLTAGPILRIRSSCGPDTDMDDDISANLKFSHMVHARFRAQPQSEVALAAKVEQLVRPICDHVVAIDWVAQDLKGPVVPKPGSALRLTLFSLQQQLDASCQDQIQEDRKLASSENDDGLIVLLLEGLGRINDKWKLNSENPSCSFHLEQFSYGRNIDGSAEKEYNLGALLVFPDLNELDACEEFEDEMRSLIRNHKIQPFLHALLHLDYVLPRLTL